MTNDHKFAEAGGDANQANGDITKLSSVQQPQINIGEVKEGGAVHIHNYGTNQSLKSAATGSIFPGALNSSTPYQNENVSGLHHPNTLGLLFVVYIIGVLSGALLITYVLQNYCNEKATPSDNKGNETSPPKDETLDISEIFERSIDKSKLGFSTNDDIFLYNSYPLLFTSYNHQNKNDLSLVNPPDYFEKDLKKSIDLSELKRGSYFIISEEIQWAQQSYIERGTHNHSINSESIPDFSGIGGIFFFALISFLFLKRRTN